MSSKKILSGLVIAGGGLYYYDQNVDPIVSRVLIPEKVPQPSYTATPPVMKDELKKQEPAGIRKELEDKYNQIESKTSELSSRLTSSFQSGSGSGSGSGSAHPAADRFNSGGTIPKPGEGFSLRLAVANYFDYINSVGESLMGKKTSEVPNTEEVKSNANSWFNWGTQKAKDVGEEEKSAALKQYEAAKSKLDDLTKQIKEKSPFQSQQEEQDYLKSAQDDFNKAFSNLKKYGSEVVEQANATVESTKSSWFSWGKEQKQDLEEQKSFAIKQYEAAQAKFDSLTQQIKDNSPFKSKQEEEDHLKAAQDDLNKAFSNLGSYGRDTIDQVKQDYYKPLKDKITK